MSSEVSSPSPMPTPVDLARELGEDFAVPNLDEEIAKIAQLPIVDQARELDNLRRELVDILNQTRINHG